MAIKIIKHGKTRFKVTCPICGCEFEYDKEDTRSFPGQKPYVQCPDCKSCVEHKQTKKLEVTWNEDGNVSDKDKSNKMFYVDYKNPYVSWNNSEWPDCENCLNKPDPNKIVFGDTPCTLCIKNQPYCVSTSSNLKDIITESNLDSVKNWTFNTDIKKYQGK